MLESSSQRSAEFDQFLLSIEELFRHRHPERASEELSKLESGDYHPPGLARGLYLSLSAEAALFNGRYTQAIEFGAEALKTLAPSSHHRRVGRILWNLSKCYSALGDLPEADMRARDAISAYRRAEHRPGVVDGLNELAKIAFIRSQYPKAAEFLQDALVLIESDPAKEQQIRSNLGRVKTLAGHLDEAEKLLKTALDYDLANDLDLSAARNHLSLGYLRFRQRRFSEATESYNSAEKLIRKWNMIRERLNLAEYRGELAFEKGDYREAKDVLSWALSESEELAPDSGLVTQIGRRLAETYAELGDVDEAISLAQKSLERSERLGERVEIGLCQVIVGLLFSGSSDKTTRGDGIHYFEKGITTLREVNDTFELGRALLRAVTIYPSTKANQIRRALTEARALLSKQGATYYEALATFYYASQCFADGDFSEGYQPLCDAREIFEALGDLGRLRQVEALMQSVANDAVALSLSAENSFVALGGFASGAVTGDGGIESSLATIKDKTGADRVLVVSYEDGRELTSSTANIPANARADFANTFRKLLGEEFATEKPTLLLDVTRDPYVNELLPGGSSSVSSVIVSPMRVDGKVSGYLYLDKLTDPITRGAEPFTQPALNFAVGIADFIALQIAQRHKAQLVEDNRRLKEQMQEKVGLPSILTQNAGMLELLARVRQIVDSDISVTISGETGCGKDLLAKAIHYNSNRRDKRFISVNCAALPETLLESELFGYKRGAFTGADRDKPGLLEEADGGTFFLDEIGDMPLSVQAKLLRALEAKEVVRLGDSTPRHVDVRFISATHKDLHDAMKTGDFRQDLYYRLSALSFRLPALRERREDIPVLIEKFKNGDSIMFTDAAMRALVEYDWPGNVRELENEVKKLCLVCRESGEVSPQALSPKIAGAVSSNVSEAFGSFQPAVAVPNGDFSLYDFIADHERQFITNALTKSQGVKKHAAQLLQIPESTLRLKIKQYDIDMSHFGPLH